MGLFGWQQGTVKTKPLKNDHGKPHGVGEFETFFFGKIVVTSSGISKNKNQFGNVNVHKIILINTKNVFRYDEFYKRAHYLFI